MAKQNKVHFGKWIREKRRRKDITQEKFANELGIHKMLVSRWERDEVTPNVYNFLAAIKILDVSEEEFVNTFLRKTTLKELKESSNATTKI